MQNSSLKVALPKGRLYDEVIEACLKTDLLASSEQISRLSRQLVQEVSVSGHLFLLAKPVDVPAYVEHGAADIGFTGKDIIAEKDRQLYEVFDLDVGNCDLVVAVPEEMEVADLQDLPDNLRVATSYPRTTHRFFRRHNIKTEIIELGGSVELAPQVDLADIIVDITSTGTTLRENNLEPVAKVLSSSVRMVVNQSSYRTKSAAISKINRQLKQNFKAASESEEKARCSG